MVNLDYLFFFVIFIYHFTRDPVSLVLFIRVRRIPMPVLVADNKLMRHRYLPSGVNHCATMNLVVEFFTPHAHTKETYESCTHHSRNLFIPTAHPLRRRTLLVITASSVRPPFDSS